VKQQQLPSLPRLQLRQQQQQKRQRLRPLPVADLQVQLLGRSEHLNLYTESAMSVRTVDQPLTSSVVSKRRSSITKAATRCTPSWWINGILTQRAHAPA
jgi:hypothetical protein